MVAVGLQAVKGCWYHIHVLGIHVATVFHRKYEHYDDSSLSQPSRCSLASLARLPRWKTMLWNWLCIYNIEFLWRFLFIMHNKMMISWRVIIICWSSHCLVSSEPPGLPDFAESLNCWWIAFQKFLSFFLSLFLSFSNVSSCLEGNRLLGQNSQLKHNWRKVEWN